MTYNVRSNGCVQPGARSRREGKGRGEKAQNEQTRLGESCNPRDPAAQDHSSSDSVRVCEAAGCVQGRQRQDEKGPHSPGAEGRPGGGGVGAVWGLGVGALRRWQGAFHTDAAGVGVAELTSLAAARVAGFGRGLEEPELSVPSAEGSAARTGVTTVLPGRQSLAARVL